MGGGEVLHNSKIMVRSPDQAVVPKLDTTVLVLNEGEVIVQCQSHCAPLLIFKWGFVQPNMTEVVSHVAMNNIKIL